MEGVVPLGYIVLPLAGKNPKRTRNGSYRQPIAAPEASKNFPNIKGKNKRK
jgi:hypothetical protein